MKPRNKTEREVMKLSSRLGSIGKRDEARLVRNTYGRCPYDDMYDRCYAVINQAFHGWQVLRYFRIDRHRDRRRKVGYSTWEVFQLWNMVGHKQVLVARQRAMSLYVDAFVYGSRLEIRDNPTYSPSYLHFSQVDYDYIYDKSLTGTFLYADELIDKAECYRWYRWLASDKFAETILKLRPALALYMMQHNVTDHGSFTAVRIAMRHGYEISQPSVYFAMLSAMEQLKCDLNNPHYVCPDDLQHTHDWAMAAIERRRQERQRERDREKVALQVKEDTAYVNSHGQYFDLLITDGLITCHVLRSVKEFYDEGLTMHHCVYANAYYTKPNSLIFSARINGKRVETVEFSLERMKVIQAYGACDKFTMYHQRIVDLVNANKQLILNHNKQIAI